MGDKLKWDKPNCKGWQDDVLLHYTVDFHKNELIYLDETFLVVDDDFKKVTINVTNICGETATLATVTNYNNIYGNDLYSYVMNSVSYTLVYTQDNLEMI